MNRAASLSSIKAIGEEQRAREPEPAQSLRQLSLTGAGTVLRMTAGLAEELALLRTRIDTAELEVSFFPSSIFILGWICMCVCVVETLIFISCFLLCLPSVPHLFLH